MEVAEEIIMKKVLWISLENSRVLLLPFESERRSELKRIIFDHDIWRYMGIKIETESDFECYVHETLESKKQGVCYPFIIVDKQTKEVAGSTRFGNINQKNGKMLNWVNLVWNTISGNRIKQSCQIRTFEFWI